jgi:hypothetical protein
VVLLGLLMARIGMEKGPRVVMGISFICETVGFVLAWLVTAGRIPNVPAWGFALVYLLIGFASGGCITTALVVNARNFLPEDRGKACCSLRCVYVCAATNLYQVTGVLTGSMALGGFAFSWISESMMPFVSHFILASLVVTVIGTGLGVLLMHYVPHPDVNATPKVCFSLVSSRARDLTVWRRRP